MRFEGMLPAHELRRNLTVQMLLSRISRLSQSICDRTEYHAVDAKLLAVLSIPFEQEHMSCTAQKEEQQEDGVDWHIWYDRGRLAQGL